MRSKRFVTVFALVFVLALMLNGCSGSTPTASSSTQPAQSSTSASATTPEPTGEPMNLRMGFSASLTTGDPGMTGSTTDQAVLMNIFDPLVRRDAKGALQPSLADSWTNVEPNVWEFKLHKGVTFHNGEPFNAAAVKFSLERIFTEGSKSPIQELRSFQSVDAIDDLTVKITTKTPDPYVPDKLALFAGMMVPPKYIQEKGAEYFNSNPVGTGPFVFKEWVKDSHITMTANKNYWKEPTKLSELTFKFIPDGTARVAALLAGDVDLIDQVGATAINSVKNNPNYRLDVADGVRIYYMSMAYTEGPTADARVRQAISYAIDTQAIIDKMMGGYGIKIAGPYNTSNFGADVNIQPYQYDTAKAKSLLAEAGFPNGFDIDMNTDAGGSALAQAIADMLKQVGINVKLSVMPDAEYEDKYSNGQLAPLWVNGYSVWQGDPSTLIGTFFKTGMPRAKYFSPELDAKINDMQSTLDSAQRLTKLHDILTILHNDAPWAYIYQAKDVYGVNKKVTWDTAYDRMIELRTATVSK